VKKPMSNSTSVVMKKATAFIAMTYLSALISDIAALYGLLQLISWGFLRMWSVAISTVICSAPFKEGVSPMLKKYLKFSVKSLKLYLLSPFIVYLALGVYIVIASSLGFFDFSAYVELIAVEIAKTSDVTEAQAVRLATSATYIQIVSAYVAAITVNAVFALGEEIGWRGYLYDLLGSKPSIKAVLTIGIVWGLWHASATILLGYNYQLNRLTGVVLFTLITLFFTYPQLIVTSRTGGSVLPASSFHGMVNSIWGLTVVASRLSKELGEVVLGLGFTGIIAWIAVDIALYMILKMHNW